MRRSQSLGVQTECKKKLTREERYGTRRVRRIPCFIPHVRLVRRRVW